MDRQGEAIDQADDWTKLASEEDEKGTASVFVNHRFQMHILLSDASVIPAEQSSSYEVRLRTCEVQTVRSRWLYDTDSSLFWQFKSIDLRGLWDGVERIDAAIANQAVKRLAERYVSAPEYAKIDEALGSQATGGGYGRCIHDAVEYVGIFMDDEKACILAL